MHRKIFNIGGAQAINCERSEQTARLREAFMGVQEVGPPAH